jgi:hypothetical protein
MSFALIGIAGILICWKWGDWRHWSLYYPTILYLLIGDLVSDYLLCSHPLFGFGEFIEQYAVLDVCVMLLLYPATVILFLSFYPEPQGKQALYILMWVAIYTAAEWIASKTGGFCYHDGWTIWYSLVFNMVMFPLLRLHYKKPLWVWPISAALCFAFLWWFRIPLAR